MTNFRYRNKIKYRLMNNNKLISIYKKIKIIKKISKKFKIQFSTYLKRKRIQKNKKFKKKKDYKNKLILLTNKFKMIYFKINLKIKLIAVDTNIITNKINRRNIQTIINKNIKKHTCPQNTSKKEIDHKTFKNNNRSK